MLFSSDREVADYAEEVSFPSFFVQSAMQLNMQGAEIPFTMWQRPLSFGIGK